MNYISRTDRGAGTAAQALIGIDKCAVLGNLDRSGRAGLFAKAAADTANRTDILADGILVRAEDNDGVVLQTKVDDTLRAGMIARAAADTSAFIHLGDAVGIQADCAKRADLNTGAAAGAAVCAQIISFRRFFCAAAAVAVNTGDFGRKLLFDDHKKLPF